MMARGKILAICQSGGDFVTNSDGSMSYSGGEAHAIDIDHEVTLQDLKSEISVMFIYNANSFSIKYFLPNNKQTLITVSNDKDLKRMVDFHADSEMTVVYVLKKVENRTTRSVVADSGTPTDNTITATVATYEDAMRRRLYPNWDGMITGVGQKFDSSRAFRDALHKYAIVNSFMYRFIKNDRCHVTAECTAEDCPWRVHASRLSGKQELMIKKMNGTHTCGKEMSKKCYRLASQRWVASIIKDKLRYTPNYKPRDVADDLQREYGLSLNYAQAWRGKFLARKELYNSHEEACNQLPWFCNRIIETNPGSVATLQTSDDSKFRLFVAFHASLSGFEHGCRPLIFLDVISLKANKQWKLLAATTVDGENDIFPVAFSAVEMESSENWHWFLEQLKSALTMPHNLTFISNGQDGLEEIPRVFEDSNHGYSVHHLIENFKTQLEDSWTQEIKDAMVDHLNRAVYACKADEFNECIEGIKAESKELAEWVLDTKPERWSDAFFKGLRYGCYSSRTVETFNGWVSERNELSLVQMVDMIRCKLMEMVYTRRQTSNTWAGQLTPSMNQKVQDEMIKARNLKVICSMGNVFEVHDDSINVVNIENWECTCRRWQVTGWPCMHALAVFQHIDRCMYDYCSKYFTTECYCLTYSLSINPIPDVGRPSCTDPSHCTFACPRTRRLAGRPKEKPADPRIAIKRAVRCSRCKEFGHNKQTCKAPA